MEHKTEIKGQISDGQNLDFKLIFKFSRYLNLILISCDKCSLKFSLWFHFELSSTSLSCINPTLKLVLALYSHRSRHVVCVTESLSMFCFMSGHSVAWSAVFLEVTLCQ